jgi:HD-GYP domain-containing protein (c-di-GMP phosphodiesterase class II)/predicted MFS family arabinose efflux permease
VLLFGAALVPAALLVHPIDFRQDKLLLTLVYLAVGTQIASLLPIRWTHGNQYIYDPLLVATGLIAPGAGVAVVAWLALFDGRLPGRDAPWWALAYNRANQAIANALPSLVVAAIPTNDDWWTLPARTIIYVVLALVLNYSLVARVLSFVNRTSFWTTLSQNVGAATLSTTMMLSFSGGILYLLLLPRMWPVGFIMAPGMFGFLLVARGAHADAQRQTRVKDQTLDLAAQALDARDRYTESHSIRVSELAGRLGEHLDLGNRQCELLRTAGSLHDLGKIGVRDDILNKPGPLTEEEWEIMRRHPDIGADMIAQHSALAEVAPLVRHHHERWDGTGYPSGYKGDVIPFGARILSVADSFDTITGPRLYRQSLMTSIEGVEDISRRAGHWYDPNVVDALRALHGLSELDLPDRPEVPRRITNLRVLRSSPAFTRLFAAIGISSLGDPLTQVATLVAIYSATGKAGAVALGFIAQALGTIVMSGALGGIADRFTRRRLVVTLELLRAAILGVLAVVGPSVWLIVPVLFVLAMINAIVQPARQAAVPGLVPAGLVGRANAMVATAGTLAGAAGFGLAGVILALTFQSSGTRALFLIDAVTFAIAAAILLGIPNLGGGITTIRLTGALRGAWTIEAVRPHLTIGALAGFLLAMSFPALFALAYKVATSDIPGAQTYSLLEVVLSAGVFVGTLIVGRAVSIGTMRIAGAGLLLTGVFSLAMIFNPSIFTVAVFLFAASIGNPIYTVANQTALVEAADPSNRGSVMATRFTFVQTASIAGTALGGVLTQVDPKNGPLIAFGVLAVGLILLGLFALAAGRIISNPLHGAAYEEATIRAAAADPRVK